MEPLYILALLACPVGMGAMMWFMSKGLLGGNKHKGEEGPQAEATTVENLRDQQQRLAADIARLEEHDASVGELQPAAKH
jgi:flagellar basal body-associated protein FliL